MKVGPASDSSSIKLRLATRFSWKIPPQLRMTFFPSDVPVTQSGEWINDSGAGVNAFGTSGAEYNSLDSSLCYDSFENLNFPPPDGIMGHPSQMHVNINSGNEYLHHPESPSINRHSPSHHSFNTASNSNSPQNFIVSPSLQGSIPTGTSPRASVSPESSSSKTDNPSSRIEKRTRNTLAARRYRQKRVDQVSSLESALKKSESEKEDLKVRVARLEGELEAMKNLMKSKG